MKRQRSKLSRNRRQTAATLKFEPLESRRLLAADPFVDLQLAINLAGDVRTDRGYAIAHQADGQIVIGGVVGKNNLLQASQDQGASRFNPDGTLDTSFDGDGVSLSDFGLNSRDFCTALDIQGDGKILCSGTGHDYDSNFDTTAILTRYNTDGSIDGTFSFRFPGVDTEARGVAELSNGKIQLMIKGKIGANKDVQLMRLNSDLSLDTSFGVGGIVNHDFNAVGNDGHSMAIQSDGKILVAGVSEQMGYMVRFNADGTLDTDYTEAQYDLSPAGFNSFRGIILDSNDNSAYVTGRSEVSIGDFETTIVKFTNTGAVDANYGNNGVFRYNLSSTEYDAGAAAMDQTGKIYLAGYLGQDTNQDSVILRVNANGTLDTDFANGGVFIVDMANDWDRFRAIDIDALNRPVATGEGQNNGTIDTWLVRLDPRFNVNTYNSTDVPQSIPDQGTITSTIDVADSLNITDLNVQLDISHTRDADLDVYLISPSGTRVQLFTDVGGSGDNFADTILDDQAGTAITTGSAPFVGVYRPEGSLADFSGEDALGDWTLEVSDDRKRQTGTLNSWSIEITSGQSLPASFSIDDASVVEGDSGPTTASFTVTRSGDTDVAVSVDYETQEGTATSPEDYVDIALTTLTFGIGETSKTVDVTVNGDTLDEGDHAFVVNLSNPSAGASISKLQGVGTIQDDDGPVASTMHVVDLDATTSPGSRGKWNAFVTITVHDASGNVVANATVNGIWSNGASGSATCITDANGQCTVNKNNINKNSQSVTFTVTNLVHTSLTYDPFANEDEDEDSDGTEIVILKP